MKAVCWMGKENMQVHNVPDPTILNPRDAIIRITTTCICGSDLHLYNGFMPTLEPGDVIEASVEKVGTIRNRVVAEKDAPADWRWQPTDKPVTGF